MNRLQVAIDCADPERLATFWAAVLGYVVDAEVTRLQTLGGTHLRTEQDEYDCFAVMADPEGNEFCIN